MIHRNLQQGEQFEMLWQSSKRKIYRHEQIIHFSNHFYSFLDFLVPLIDVRDVVSLWLHQHAPLLTDAYTLVLV